MGQKSPPGRRGIHEPVKVVPYFGSIEKPECHLLYNVTTMCTTWHTVATRDTRLLRRQLDAVNALPKKYVFLNYLRCHDDIGWGLDYEWLKQNFGTDEVLHKRYLNDYFQGYTGNSNSRGELYNDDIASGDDGLLAISRYAKGQKIIGVFNFTEWEKTVTFPYDPEEFTDMLTREACLLQELSVPAYGFYYLEQWNGEKTDESDKSLLFSRARCSAVLR